MGLLAKLFGASKGAQKDRGDYGTLAMPPSAEAGALLAAMTDEERLNFADLLRHLQEWHESVAETDQLSFHPEARALLWGAGLAKIADHYREVGRNDEALFFTSAAWKLSRYPVFAFNLAVMSFEAGDVKGARTLFQTYLAEYRNVLTSPSMRLINPNITAEELETLARSARANVSSSSAVILGLISHIDGLVRTFRYSAKCPCSLNITARLKAKTGYLESFQAALVKKSALSFRPTSR